MILTKENFKLFAANNYDNPYCITEEEFDKDLRQISTIKRMLSKHISGDEVNLKLLVNNVIIYYNVFEHHAATKMLAFKTDDEQKQYLNSILKFLSFPLIIPPFIINEEFYKQLEREFE